MTEKEKLFTDFNLQVGDRIYHNKEQVEGCEGTITQIDFDSYPFYEYSVTTCLVLWDDSENKKPDIAWTNRLVKI